MSLGFVELVDLCGQDEIALRQTVDFVRPACDLDFSPSKEDVWVPLLFPAWLTNLRASRKSGNLEGLRDDVVFFDDVPAVHLLFEGGKLLTLERRHSSSARDARFRR